MVVVSIRPGSCIPPGRKGLFVLNLVGKLKSSSLHNAPGKACFTAAQTRGMTALQLELDMPWTAHSQECCMTQHEMPCCQRMTLQAEYVWVAGAALSGACMLSNPLRG